MEIKLLIVDDYNIFRSGLKLILEKHKNFEIIGEASNSNELFKQLENIRPDVIVLNLMLPQKQIFSITRKLFKTYPDIPSVLLTVGADELIILDCVVNGARGILWKESTTEQLIEAINTVAAGERYLDIPESKITAKIIQHAQNSQSKNRDFSELSEREQQVLKLFAEGLSYKTISEQLNISTRTVESHKNNILTKLELNTVVDMVKYAIKHSLIEI